MTLSFIGLFLILIGWISQTWQTIKNKKCQLEIQFVILYMVGSGLLAWHAFNISDIVFLILNAGATLMGLINFYYYLLNKINKKHASNSNRN